MGSKIKIVTVVGARPQFIKAAPVSKLLRERDRAVEVLVHTGQHYDANMSGVFFSELEMGKPAYHLGVHGGGHGAMTGRMLEALETVLEKEKPDCVLVYGDTNSTLAGALAAAKLKIPVSHVEAGLRSRDRGMPEEINRILTDHVSEQLFAPTLTAVENLKAENFLAEKIHHSGDVMFDVARRAVQPACQKQLLEGLDLKAKNYVLATLHRAENTDSKERLFTWLEALNAAGERERVVLPLHPRTLARIEGFGGSREDFSNIDFLDPVGYLDMANLTAAARLVATDSGGLQKEAYFHRVPGLIMRPETEWVELTQCGWSRLVPCSVEAVLDAQENFQPSSPWGDALFGNGRAAECIVEVMLNTLA